jgi:acetoin utilization protein AcuB
MTAMGTITVRDVMVRKVHFLPAEADLEEAFRLMAAHSLRHVVIADPVDHKLLGIISDRDVKRFISPFIGSPREDEKDRLTLKIKLGSMMKKDVVSATEDDPLRLVVEKMLQRKIHAVPVVDTSHCAIGMVTSSDLMRFLLKFL